MTVQPGLLRTPYITHQRKRFIHRYTQTGLFVLMFATGVAASACDEELCSQLGNLVPLASSKFKDIRGSKTDDDTYKARLLLPGAKLCELSERDRGKKMAYVCQFQLNAGRDADVESGSYADNIQACIPGLERSKDGRTIFLMSERLMFQFTPFTRRFDLDLNYRTPD